MRQVVLDTETTGIGAETGHRIIEIGCIELIDRKLTGQHFHTYINPERQVDEGAFRVHGISNEFLQDKPLFAHVMPQFWQFIAGAELIIHNAPFDLGFIAAELKRASWSKAVQAHCTILDTLELARAKHPGQRNSLDALCKRYDVNNSNRQLHGALLDAELLAFVYLAMTGGQVNLFMGDEAEQISVTTSEKHTETLQLSSHSPVIMPSAEELEEHQALMQFLINKSGRQLWDETLERT